LSDTDISRSAVNKIINFSLKNYTFQLARKVFPFVATVWCRVCTETTNTYIQCCHIPAKTWRRRSLFKRFENKSYIMKIVKYTGGGVPKNVCIIYMYICISIADTITLNIKNSNNHNKHKDTNPLRYLSHLFNDTWPYIKFICISMYIRFFWHPLYIYIKYILLKCVFVRLCMPNAYAWGYCIFLQKLCMNPMMSFSECALYLFLLCVCKIILPCWWWCSPTCYIWYRLYFIAN